MQADLPVNGTRTRIGMQQMNSSSSSGSPHNNRHGDNEARPALDFRNRDGETSTTYRDSNCSAASSTPLRPRSVYDDVNHQEKKKIGIMSPALASSSSSQRTPHPTGAAGAAAVLPSAQSSMQSQARPSYRRRATNGTNGGGSNMNSPSNPLLSLVHLDHPVQVPMPPSLERRLSANNVVHHHHHHPKPINQESKSRPSRSQLEPPPPSWYDHDEFGTARGNLLLDGSNPNLTGHLTERDPYTAPHDAYDQDGRHHPGYLVDYDRYHSLAYTPRRPITPGYVAHVSAPAGLPSISSSSSSWPPHNIHRRTSVPVHDYRNARDV